MSQGEYLMCPSCGNSKIGHEIARCPQCGKIFCTACRDDGWAGWKCPSCGRGYGMMENWIMGKIQR